MAQNDNINAARIDSGFVMPPDRLSGMGKELSFEAIYERLPDDVGDSHHWGWFGIIPAGTVKMPPWQS